MMDATLAQILNHIYDLETEKAQLIDFIKKNEGVLRQANAEMPVLDQPAPAAAE